MDAFASIVLFLLSLSFCISLFFLGNLLLRGNCRKFRSKLPLPPAASSLPVLAHIFIQRRSIFEITPILRRLHSLHGPILTLRPFPFSRPSVFISDPSLAHSTLIRQGATFADRPLSVQPIRFLNGGNRDINSAHYGSLWRLLRRNLTSETLNPSRIRLFSPARHWSLHLLLDTLRSQSSPVGFTAKESFQHANFSLLLLMCFGEKLLESQIREIESSLVFLIRLFTSFNILAVVPAFTKVLFRKKWERIVSVRRREAEIFLPLIRARQEGKNNGDLLEYCYVDSLHELKLPEDGGRGLTDDEMVILCHEFLSAGIDTTSTALEWTMAELVKNQDVQSKIFTEIDSLIGRNEEEIIKEEDLHKMTYLKAVVLETLRRHPPAPFLLPHSVTEDVTVEGFLIPKGTEVNFSVVNVNWDRSNWEEPMEFRPERFMAGGSGEGVDITGNKEIKMITFGAGRRMCPGYGLAMLHLEFFVANLVREFEWKATAGDEVDLSERLEFTTVMKNPLRAQIFPRRKE